LAWRIEFDDAAKQDLAKLDKENARRITKFLRERLAERSDPRSIGEALKGTKLGELWRYRVGDYRIIAAIEDETVRVLVVRIGNRREIYRS
jgi:mRNA interferase RelE/StbE